MSEINFRDSPEMKSLQSNLTLEEMYAKKSKLRKEAGDEKNLWNFLAYESVYTQQLEICKPDLSRIDRWCLVEPSVGSHSLLREPYVRLLPRTALSRSSVLGLGIKPLSMHVFSVGLTNLLLLGWCRKMVLALWEMPARRLNEAVMHFGESIKEIINEEFGDGIMSAIDFFCSVDKVKGVDGKDRVVLTFDGKYLAHTEQNHPSFSILTPHLQGATK